jgi:hypothetical protein
MFFENTSMPNLKTLPENLPCPIICTTLKCYFGKTSSRHLGKNYTVETDM